MVIDPEGTRLPIKLDSTSNGEYVPVPLAPANLAANRLAHEYATANAQKLGISRRKFLICSSGAASTLLAFNQPHGTAGGFYDVHPEAALDEQLARLQTGPAKSELVFDVQGHFIDTPKGNSKGPEVFIKDVFMDSDTDLMVLSFVPSTREAEPVTIQAADAVRRLVDRLEGTHRLLLHGRVNPNQAGDLEGMDELAQKWGVSAWKTYTQYGPGGRLLPLRRRRHALHREGARARRESDLRPQGPALRQAVLRAQPMQRHRRGGEALPGCEVPHLSLGLRHQRERRPVRERRRHRHPHFFPGEKRSKTE